MEFNEQIETPPVKDPFDNNRFGRIVAFKRTVNIDAFAVFSGVMNIATRVDARQDEEVKNLQEIGVKQESGMSFHFSDANERAMGGYPTAKVEELN